MRLPAQTLPTRRYAHPRSPVRQGFRVALACVAIPLLVHAPLLPCLHYLPNYPKSEQALRSRITSTWKVSKPLTKATSYGVICHTNNSPGKAQRMNHYQAPTNPMLVLHDPLQQFCDLDRTSPQLYPQPTDFPRRDKYREAVPSLQSDDLTWLIKYMDSESPNYPSLLSAQRWRRPFLAFPILQTFRFSNPRTSSARYAASRKSPRNHTRFQIPLGMCVRGDLQQFQSAH